LAHEITGVVIVVRFFGRSKDKTSSCVLIETNEKQTANPFLFLFVSCGVLFEFLENKQSQNKLLVWSQKAHKVARLY